MLKLKAIIPKLNIFNPARMTKAVRAGLDDAAKEAKADFESTTATWSHQPTFVMDQGTFSVKITTDDDVWNMLEQGTRPHIIVAHGRALRFSSGYRAKTRPGFIGSTSGGTSGATVFRRVVHHPGTKARGWSALIAKKWRGQLASHVQRRIGEALR